MPIIAHIFLRPDERDAIFVLRGNTFPQKAAIRNQLSFKWVHSSDTPVQESHWERYCDAEHLLSLMSDLVSVLGVEVFLTGGNINERELLNLVRTTVRKEGS